MIKRGRPVGSTKANNKSDTPEYKIYRGAKKRCEDPNRKEFKYYGGRGIKFLFDSFENFLTAVGPRPSPDHTLERLDNNRHYEKGNLAWVTRSENLKNRNPYSHHSKTKAAPAIVTRNCKSCGLEFEPVTAQKYCSSACNPRPRGGQLAAKSF